VRDWPDDLAKRRLHKFYGQGGSIWMWSFAVNRENSRRIAIPRSGDSSYRVLASRSPAASEGSSACSECYISMD